MWNAVALNFMWRQTEGSVPSRARWYCRPEDIVVSCQVSISACLGPNTVSMMHCCFLVADIEALSHNDDSCLASQCQRPMLHLRD